jgi:GTP pyrophosphokinase
VNNKLVSLSHKLNSGDQVEVVTSSAQKVEKKWLEYVTTAKATNKINVFLRKDEREKKKDGEKILQEFFEKRELTYNTVAVERIARAHDLSNAQDLLLEVGEGRIVLDSKDEDAVKKKNSGKKKKKTGWKRIIPFTRRKDDDAETEGGEEEKPKEKIDKKKPVIITDSNINKQYIMAECCKPIPGDLVMGYLNDKKQIVIHTVECSVAERLKANHGNRVLSAEWNMTGDMMFMAKILIQGMDRIGLLNDVTQIISNQYNTNMKRLLVECNEDMFTCNIQLLVKNKTQVDEVIQQLKGISGVNTVARI